MKKQHVLALFLKEKCVYTMYTLFKLQNVLFTPVFTTTRLCLMSRVSDMAII